MKDQVETLLAMVRHMRGAQRLYFKTRSPDSLEQARKAERAVDKMIAEYDAAEERRKQPQLF